MKKSVLFGLLLLVCSRLYGMEVEEEVTSTKPFPFDQLPSELQCTIARYALPDQMPIDPKDAVQAIAECASSEEVFSAGDRILNGVTVRDNRGDKVANAEAEYARDAWVYSVAVFPKGDMVVSGRIDERVKIENAKSGELQAEYAHDAWVYSVAVFSDGDRVLSRGHDNKVKIYSLIPLLLAKHTLEKPNLDRYRLLKEVQERLLKEKKPLFIKQSKRAVLEEMPELKKLLKIEKSKTNPIWRLQMKYAPSAATSGDGKSEK